MVLRLKGTASTGAGIETQVNASNLITYLNSPHVMVPGYEEW